MRPISKDESCVVFLVACLLIIGVVVAYSAGWDKGYRAALVDAKKGLPPKWVITQRDDGTSGWERSDSRKERE